MNPFENEETPNTSIKSINIEIWLVLNGRRKNTYACGLDFEPDILKEHLKNLKKKHGCNGSLKELSVDGQIKKVLHLQGDHIESIQSYLNSINITNITIRDFQSIM
jgi:translation initiation factor 1 (eIF-1/SUI1)